MDTARSGAYDGLVARADPGVALARHNKLWNGGLQSAMPVAGNATGHVRIRHRELNAGIAPRERNSTTATAAAALIHGGPSASAVAPRGRTWVQSDA